MAVSNIGTMLGKGFAEGSAAVESIVTRARDKVKDWIHSIFCWVAEDLQEAFPGVGFLFGINNHFHGWRCKLFVIDVVELCRGSKLKFNTIHLSVVTLSEISQHDEYVGGAS